LKDGLRTASRRSRSPLIILLPGDIGYSIAYIGGDNFPL
jgi:hypothetical protein